MGLRLQPSQCYTVYMVVDEILDGKFHVDDGSLDFSCPRVNLSLRADGICEGSFSCMDRRGF